MTDELRHTHPSTPSHAHGDHSPYEHAHVDPTCTHRWRTCPVHGRPDGELPPFRVSVTCIYGGTKLRTGEDWDETTTDTVAARLLAHLER